jgi:diacylglycerol kinase (ATP)|tara:strand:- start:83 stop:424 length:342 start_codon:yes stop_codon:yes gene_type:complete
MKKFFFNLINSINGLKIALTEHSFIAEIIGGFVLIPYLIITDLNNIFKLIIIILYFLLLAFELLNTAIEKLSDKITKNFDEDIKKIKDISSASVFMILSLLIISLILIIFVLT